MKKILLVIFLTLPLTLLAEGKIFSKPISYPQNIEILGLYGTINV